MPTDPKELTREQEWRKGQAEDGMRVSAIGMAWIASVWITPHAHRGGIRGPQQERFFIPSNETLLKNADDQYRGLLSGEMGALRLLQQEITPRLGEHSASWLQADAARGWLQRWEL